MGFAFGGRWVDIAMTGQMSAAFLFLNANTMFPAIADLNDRGNPERLGHGKGF